MRIWVALLAFLSVAIALVCLADERIGVRHVKWLSKIEVKRVPE